MLRRSVLRASPRTAFKASTRWPRAGSGSAPPAGPTNTAAPSISGTPNVGVTLICSNGTWTGAAPISYSFQWLRGASAISGATSASYTLTADDLGATISCTVAASDANGVAFASAAGVGPVAVGSIAPLTGAVIPATYSDTASGNVAPITLVGDSIALDVDGYTVRLDTTGGQSIADATKMTVNLARAGYSTSIGSAVNNNNLDVGYGTKLLRRVSPNQANAILNTGSSFLLAIDNLIHASDIITSIVLRAGFFTGQVADIVVPTSSITRNDTILYDKPMVRPIDPWYRHFTTTATLEFAVVSEWATGGQQVARVEATWKRSGAYGTWAGANTMVRSNGTPASGRNPGGLAAPVFRVTVDLTGCTDTAARGDTLIVYRAYSFFGDRIFDSEVDGAALQGAGLPTSLSPPVGVPIIKDAAGNHSDIRAWINRDGTAGGSAAIQTGTADPGSAASYANENAALTAARAYNLVNRGHNTTSGIILMYRDVAGGSLGNSNLAYWQRATMSGFSDGLRPPVLCSASYLTSGTTSLDCRRRGVQDDGTTAATSKVFTGMFEFRGLTFDSTSLTGASHQIHDGQTGGAATTVGAATAGCIVIDCDIRENSAAGSTVAALSRSGWMWHYRVDHENPTGATALGSNAAAFAGTMASVGSKYYAASFVARSLWPVCLVGVCIDNMQIIDQAAGAAPDFSDGLIIHVRMDLDTPTSAPVQLATTNRSGQRRGISGLMIRKVGTNTGAAIQISADGQLNVVNSIVVQHLGCDAGGDSGNDNDRLNIAYNDQGYIQLLKRATMRYCALGSTNGKDDTFAAPELPSAYATAWTATTAYRRGQLVHDGNATPASRVIYTAIADFTSGATQATDLANTGRWINCGTVNGTAFGAQPRRTGNWRFQHAVRCWGNVAARTANNDTTFSPGSWAGEVPWRGGAFLATDSTARAKYWKARTGGTLSTFSNRGDYRPQSLAAGDANDSPLLNRVEAGAAVEPFDLAGTTRRNDGTGAAGPYERSA